MYHLFACLSQMIQCECFEGEEQYCHALCHNAQNQNLLPLHIGWFNDVHTILWYNKIQYDAVQHAYISLKPPELNVFNNWIYQKKTVYSTRNRRKTPLLRQRAGSGGETSWVWRVFSWKPTPSLRPRNPGPGHCGLVDFKKWPLQSLQSFTKSNPEMSWEIRS